MSTPHRVLNVLRFKGGIQETYGDFNVFVFLGISKNTWVHCISFTGGLISHKAAWLKTWMTARGWIARRSCGVLQIEHRHWGGFFVLFYFFFWSAVLVKYLSGFRLKHSSLLLPHVQPFYFSSEISNGEKVGPWKQAILIAFFFFFFLNRKQITKVNNWMLQFLSFLLPRNVKSCHTHRESEIKTEERVGEMSGRKRCPHMTAQVSVQRWVENNTSVQLSH